MCWKSLLVPSADSLGQQPRREEAVFACGGEKLPSENHGKRRAREEKLLFGFPLQSAGDIAKGTEKNS